MKPSPHSTTSELTQLELHRQVLERLIRVARSLEVLKHGLQSILDQGTAEQGLRPELEATFRALGSRIRNMSDAEVLLRLKRLDRDMQARFRRIRPWIETGAEGAGEGADPEQALELIVGFRRFAQTGLALRILLRRRGVSVPDLRLPLERDLLTRQLESLRDREHAARSQVLKQIRVMIREVDSLLEAGSRPEPVSVMLSRVRDDLMANLAHVEAGRSMHSLPVPMEDVEAFGVPDAGAVVPAPSDPEPERQPGVMDDARSGYGQPRTQPAVKPDRPGTSEQRGRGGLLADIRTWLTSPWGVRWRDIRRRRKSPADSPSGDT